MNPPIQPKVLCNRCYGAREVTEPEHVFTFMGKQFTASPRQVACPECSVVVVRGVRKNCYTGLTSIVRVTLECRTRDLVPVVALKDGGVTGYESVYADDYFMSGTQRNGWLACCGTPGRYDSLFVPAKEMRVGLAKLGLS